MKYLKSDSLMRSLPNQLTMFFVNCIIGLEELIVSSAALVRPSQSEDDTTALPVLAMELELE